MGGTKGTFYMHTHRNEMRHQKAGKPGQAAELKAIWEERQALDGKNQRVNFWYLFIHEIQHQIGEPASFSYFLSVSKCDFSFNV